MRMRKGQKVRRNKNLAAREASSFCDFRKNYLLQFHLMLFFIFYSNKRNLCPIMIHFNALDLMCVVLKKL